MIAIYLADGFEEIEALATADLLRRAGLKAVLAGVNSTEIKGAHGITVKADVTAESLAGEDLEAVILPGGMPGAANLENSEAVIAALRRAKENGRYIAAICAAPFILGHLGYLEGKKATCYPGFEGELHGAKTTGALVEQDGKIVTGKGPGAAIPFALTLIELLKGREKAEEVRISLQCRE